MYHSSCSLIFCVSELVKLYLDVQCSPNCFRFFTSLNLICRLTIPAFLLWSNTKDDENFRKSVTSSSKHRTRFHLPSRKGRASVRTYTKGLCDDGVVAETFVNKTRHSLAPEYLILQPFKCLMEISVFACEVAVLFHWTSKIKDSKIKKERLTSFVNKLVVGRGMSYFPFQLVEATFMIVCC